MNITGYNQGAWDRANAQPPRNREADEELRAAEHYILKLLDNPAFLEKFFADSDFSEHLPTIFKAFIARDAAGFLQLWDNAFTEYGYSQMYDHLSNERFAHRGKSWRFEPREVLAKYVKQSAF